MKTNKTEIILKIDSELKVKFKTACVSQSVTMTACIERAMVEFIEKVEKAKELRRELDQQPHFFESANNTSYQAPGGDF